jgi:uncharacterized membrane protein
VYLALHFLPGDTIIQASLLNIALPEHFFPFYIIFLIPFCMNTGYLQAVVGMLRSQLKEEHENYTRALDAHRKLGEIKEIHQRIKSLEDSLYFIERSRQIYSSTRTDSGVKNSKAQ